MGKVVGIIGGGGWLGGAIAARGLSAGVLSPDRLIISARTPRGAKLADWPDVAWTADNADLVRRAHIVIVSVRPQQFPDLKLDLSGRLVLSVMAGVSMATLQRRLTADRVIRTMPNAAAEIGRSYTPWYASSDVTTADRAFTSALFATCGEDDEVSSEAQLDYLTGLAGSGSAFPALLAASMLDAAASSGIPDHIARKAVRGAVCGAVGLLDTDAFDPQEAVRIFTEYRGTTAAGLDRMIAEGLPQAVARGLEDAAARAASMAAAADA